MAKIRGSSMEEGMDATLETSRWQQGTEFNTAIFMYDPWGGGGREIET